METTVATEKVDESPFWMVQGQVGGVLLFGHRGWIGSEIQRLLSKDGELFAPPVPVLPATTQPGRSPDREVRDELETAVLHQRVTHVICAVGFTHDEKCANIDALEGGPQCTSRNARDNLFAPVMLATLCRELRVHFTYFGTGCIYGPETYTQGKAGARWLDEPTFDESSYSAMKKCTDKLMRLFIQLERERHLAELRSGAAIGCRPSGGILQIRVRMPLLVSHLPPEARNSRQPRDLLEKLKRHPLLTKLPNSITDLDELLPIALVLAFNGSNGTVNLVNHETIDPPSAMALYRRIVGSDGIPEQQTITQAELRARGLIKAGRSDCRLDPACPLLNPFLPYIRNASQAIEHSCLLRVPIQQPTTATATANLPESVSSAD